MHFAIVIYSCTENHKDQGHIREFVNSRMTHEKTGTSRRTSRLTMPRSKHSTNTSNQDEHEMLFHEDTLDGNYTPRQSTKRKKVPRPTSIQHSSSLEARDMAQCEIWPKSEYKYVILACPSPLAVDTNPKRDYLLYLVKNDREKVAGFG